MSIKIGDFALWMSADEAKSYGCTHYARMWGIIPGFWGDENSMWVSRSDLLNLVEDGLAYVAAFIAPDDTGFMLRVGKEIE